MIWRALADGVLVLHLAFIAFVVLGGLLVRWRRGFAFVHLPCAAYGAAIEWWGWICPLTPLENRLRALGGERGYAGGFIEHYLVPLVYPEPLTARMQALLGVLVAAGNVAIYAWALRGRAARRRPLRVGHLRGRSGTRR
jgi:uncharacterized protein DUF2784